jgi:hypothetical protein
MSVSPLSRQAAGSCGPEKTRFVRAAIHQTGDHTPVWDQLTAASGLKITPRPTRWLSVPESMRRIDDRRTR